jgi:murein L,D-transpeptidase YafK
VNRWLILPVLLATVAVGIWAHWPDTPLPVDARADRVVVQKAARSLELYDGGVLLKTYPISLGGNPSGQKMREGDRRTPEGRYRLDYRKLNSSFHRALHISYPSPEESTAAASRGESPGGAVMIHGIKNGLGWLGRAHLFLDWTDGCVAVTNTQIEEILRAVPDGTEIVLSP